MERKRNYTRRIYSWLAGAELRYNIIGTNESEIGAGSVSTLDILLKVGYKF